MAVLESTLIKGSLNVSGVSLENGLRVYSPNNPQINITGNAASASKLTSEAGSTNRPAYIDDGVPKPIAYTIDKSVPADAKFTDTIYTHPTFTAETAALRKIGRDSTGHVVVGDTVTSLPANGGNSDTVDGKHASDFAAATHNHDTVYLKQSGGNISGNINLGSPAFLTFTTEGKTLSPLHNSALAPVFTKEIWHDHFAFLKYHTIEEEKVKTATGSYATTDKTLRVIFDQRDTSAASILGASDASYYFILKNSNFAYSGLTWFEMTLAASKNVNITTKIEFSTDKTTWHTCAENTRTVSNSAMPFFLANNYSGIAADGYIRVTISKASSSDATVSCYSFHGYCLRKGAQGCGRELEYPYNWDSYQNIFTNGNLNTTGTLTEMGHRVYSASNPQVNITGKAGSADKLNTSAGSSSIPVYFSNGIPVACSHKLEKDVPSTAVFTDTIYTHPAYATATASLRKVGRDTTGHVVLGDVVTSLPANGGNADTVDGKHASDFAAASHIHTTYLSTGGGTIEGSLEVQQSVYGFGSLRFDKQCTGGNDGIQFHNNTSGTDKLYSASGILYYTPNTTTSSVGSPKKVYHEGNLIFDFNASSGILSITKK